MDTDKAEERKRRELSTDYTDSHRLKSRRQKDKGFGSHKAAKSQRARTDGRARCSVRYVGAVG